MVKKHLLLSALIAGLCICISSCGPAKKDTSGEERITVGRVNLHDVIVQTGEVRPVITVDLKSEASGQINKIYVTEGQRLNKRDTILVIDPKRLLYKKDQTGLSIRGSEIRRDRAKREADEAHALLSTGSVSAKQLANLEGDAQLAELTCKQQQLDLDDLNEQLTKCVVLSPMAGVLTALNVKEGEIAVSATSGMQAGTSIGTIANVAKLEIITQVGEADFPRLRLGQQVKIIPGAFEKSATPGTITFISCAAKKSSGQDLGSFEVRVSVDSLVPGIVPGVNTTVEFAVLDKKDVIGVPSYAITKEGGRAFVLKMRAPRPPRDKADTSNSGENDRANMQRGDGGNRPGGSGGQFSGASGGGRPSGGRPEGQAGRQWQGKGTGKGKNVRSPYQRVYIEIGETDYRNTEIVSGLSEGDVIIYVDESLADTKKPATPGAPRGGPGGGGGGRR